MKKPLNPGFIAFHQTANMVLLGLLGFSERELWRELLFRDKSVKLDCGLLANLGQCVSVPPEQGNLVRMTQAFSHRLNMDPFFKQEGGVGVPEVVERDPLDSTV